MSYSSLSSLYTRLVAQVLFPAHERLKGHPTVAALREMELSQWWSTSQLRAHQGLALQRFLRQVVETVPFYRSYFKHHGLTPDDFQHVGILAHLPITDKEWMRARAHELRAEECGPLIAQRTSGSTGEPFEFFLSKTRISHDIAAKWRATRWWNVDVGDREMVLWGSAIEGDRQDRVRRWRDALLRSRLIPTHELHPARLDQILADIRAFRPRQLFGYPSALARVAFHAQERGIDLSDAGIRVAFCTSETLRPEWRHAIATAFGCGVANEYGARDAGFIARECPDGGLHTTAETLIVEVVNSAGEPAANGEEGDILVTNLSGPEFPFIRYRTGDRGSLADEPCPCGRGLPRLAHISGRANDGLVSLNGSWVHGSAVNHVMRDLPGLRAYRVIQDDLHHIQLLMVTETELPPAVQQQLTQHLQLLLGAAVRVTITRVAEIPPLANGKFRHIVCNIAPPPSPSAVTPS